MEVQGTIFFGDLLKLFHKDFYYTEAIAYVLM